MTGSQCYPVPPTRPSQMPFSSPVVPGSVMGTYRLFRMLKVSVATAQRSGDNAIHDNNALLPDLACIWHVQIVLK